VCPASVHNGFIDGAGEYEIFRLSLGTLTIPQGVPMGGQTLPVNAYLVRHTQGALLFDTGLGDEFAPFDGALAPVTRSSITNSLDALDVQDIGAVVNCHLHYDHCGGNPALPGAPVYVQRREFDARNDIGYYIAERVEFPAADLRLLDGECEIAAGMRVVPTPGHTPGHQSLMIQDESGPIVLGGQVAYTVAEFENPRARPARGFLTAWDGAQFLESIESLRALKPRRLFLAHDDKHWGSGA
jgi:glyoxylase-like metal-dependent hydrolase (beta-lactamase superfamily II)